MLARRPLGTGWLRSLGPSAVDYDETDIAQRYDSGRHIPDRAMRVWFDAIKSYPAERNSPGFRCGVRDRPFFRPSRSGVCSAKIGQPALSDLASLPDAEFSAGVERMNEARPQGSESWPIIEQIDLFVFQKATGRGPKNYRLEVL